MSIKAEHASKPQAISPEIQFETPFPIRTHISNLDHELFERFSWTAELKDVVSYIARTSPKQEYPSLGILDTRFRAVQEGKIHPLSLTPMGANRDVLLGFFNLSALHPRSDRLISEDVVNLFGVAAPIKESVIGYTALSRESFKASGLGYVSYMGKIATFNELPSSNDLNSFVEMVAPGTSEFYMARVDELTLPV